MYVFILHEILPIHAYNTAARETSRPSAHIISIVCAVMSRNYGQFSRFKCQVPRLCKVPTYTDLSVEKLCNFRTKGNYSCVHISSDKVFSKKLKRPSVVEK